MGMSRQIVFQQVNFIAVRMLLLMLMRTIDLIVAITAASIFKAVRFRANLFRFLFSAILDRKSAVLAHNSVLIGDLSGMCLLVYSSQISPEILIYDLPLCIRMLAGVLIAAFLALFITFIPLMLLPELYRFAQRGRNIALANPCNALRKRLS